jgi:SagB-type dehydrogenase family enzyme
LRGSEVVLTAPDGSLAVSITGTDAELHALSAALDSCAGVRPLGEVMGSITPEYLEAVRGCLEQLATAGLIVDGRDQGALLFADLHRSIPRSASEVWEIQAKTRWRDPRAQSPQALQAAHGRTIPSALRRPGSLPLGLDEDTSEHPVDGSSLLAVLARSYGSVGNWKPVGSAGRLNPTVIHCFIPSSPGLDLYWFDDEHSLLYRVGEGLGEGAISSCFLQEELFRRSAELGRALVVLSADPSRVCGKYGNRGVSFATLEIGALEHQIALVASCLGLRTRAIGGFDPHELRAVIGGGPWPVLTVLVAKPDESSPVVQG